MTLRFAWFWLVAALTPVPLAAQYVGATACKPCHAAQFEGQSKTGHAGALARTVEHPLRRLFPDAPGEWAFGSGLQAVTFVSQRDEDHYLEHGHSYYSRSRTMDLTPGHRSGTGERYRTFAPDAAILRCFQCHSTGPLKLGDRYAIQPAEPGVRCETCHGRGAAHVDTKGASPLRNPGRMSAPELNGFCGGCHRMPAASGDDTDWSNPWNARHQPLYLAESACFLESQGRLSCLSCHDPHAPLERSTSYYDARCAGCHPKPQHRTPVAGRSCVGCHMPPVEPSPHLRFANHWVGVYEPGQPLRPIARPE